MGRAKMAVYKPDKSKDMAPHSDGSLPFGAFIVSSQIRKPLMTAAIEIVAIAKTLAGRSDDPRDGHYSDHFSINEIHGGWIKTRTDPHSKRAVVEIINDAKNAVAIEIGSGWPSEGITGGAERIAKQAGWNKAKHPLGRAAKMIGDFHE